jgi:DNA-directed RNA polymerase alpha subunit
MIGYQVKKNGKIELKTSIKDPNEANLLRRSFLTCVPSIAIDYVIFDENDSARKDDILAHRLGLMPIVYGQVENGTRFSFFFSGDTDISGNHKRITCADMEEIPFVYPNSTLTYLRKGERLSFTVVLKVDTAISHAKYKPVSTVGVKEDEDGHVFTINPMETHEPQELIELAFEGMYTASLYVSKSPFFKLRVPDTYAE